MSDPKLAETTEYKPGTFCWVELGTSNSEAAKSFYKQLFGWDFIDNPMGPDSVYTMLKLDGNDVGGLYQLSPEMTARNTPPHWLSYVAVESADDAAEKAKAAGATLIQEPFDVSTIGRMAIVQDPAGAVFALWQSGTHKGSSVCNIPNSFCWNELTTTDTAKAGDFYSDLFGWEREIQNLGPLEYTRFKNGERGAGGMLGITPEMGSMPSHWLVYFAVDDCDAKVQEATALGAMVVKPAADIPGIGRFAILGDPQGAGFAIIKIDTPDA